MLRIAMAVPILLQLATIGPEVAGDLPSGTAPEAGAASDARAGAPVALVPATSEEERYVGIACFSPRPCPPVFSREAQPVGPASGDPEKDTYGFTVLGDACR